MGRATPAIVKHPLLWVALFVVGALVLAGHIPDRSSQSAAIIDVEPTRQRQPSKKVQPTTENPNAPLVPHEQRSAANDEADCKEGEKRQECLMQWRATKAAEWQAKSADDQLWYSKVGIYLITATLAATAIAAAGAALAARSARDQVRLSRQAWIRTERAFVFPGLGREWIAAKDHVTNDIISWGCGQIWKNFGATPTVHLRVKTHRYVEADPIPVNYEFVDDPSINTIPALISPEGEIRSDPPIMFTMDEMEKFISGSLQCYTWGWAEYDDVFDKTARHRTEFCYRWSFGGDIRDEKRFSISVALHSAHNGADEECYRELITTSPKSRK